MDHLTTLDAGFLEGEDSDRHVSLAVVVCPSLRALYRIMMRLSPGLPTGFLPFHGSGKCCAHTFWTWPRRAGLDDPEL